MSDNKAMISQKYVVEWTLHSTIISIAGKYYDGKNGCQYGTIADRYLK